MVGIGGPDGPPNIECVTNNNMENLADSDIENFNNVTAYLREIVIADEEGNCLYGNCVNAEVPSVTDSGSPTPLNA